MAQLTWRNVDAPDLSRTIEGMSRLTEGVTNSFDRLGQAFKDNRAEKIKEGTGAAMAQMLMAKDSAALEGMRGGLLDPGNWKLDQMAMAQGYNQQTDTLMKRGRENELILDEAAMRTSGQGAYDSSARNYTQGAMVAPTGIDPRVMHKFLSELQGSAQEGRSGNLADTKHKFDVSEAAIDNRRQDSQLQLQRSQVAAANNERNRAATERARAEAAWNLGRSMVPGAMKGGAVNVDAVSRRAIEQAGRLNMTQAETEAMERGARVGYAPHEGSQPAYEKMPKLFGVRSELQKAAGFMAMKATQDRNAPGNTRASVLLAGYSQKDDKLDPTAAVAKYKGTDKNKFREGLRLAIANNVKPGRFLHAANLNIGNQEWSGETLDSTVMSDLITDLKTSQKDVDRHVYNLDMSDNKIAGYDSEYKRLLTAAENDVKAYGVVSPPNQSKIDAFLGQYRQSQDADAVAAAEAAQKQAAKVDALARARRPLDSR